jgi:hypothetical protein
VGGLLVSRVDCVLVRVAAQGNVGHMLRILPSSLMIALLLTGLWSTAAAHEPRPVFAQQPDPADPLVVVENFLAARNARDALGATAFCASLLPIHDAQGGQWVADPPAAIDWLRRLTDTYLIDTLVRPHADGERVAWVERLTLRSLPFRDALASSIRVEVDVVVQDGKITEYNAAYPPATPAHVPDAQRSMEPTTDSPAYSSPWSLFIATSVALAIGAALVASVSRMVGRGRRATREGQ